VVKIDGKRVNNGDKRSLWLQFVSHRQYSTVPYDEIFPHPPRRLFHTFRGVSSTESRGAVEESHVTLWGRVTRDNDEAPLETLNDVIVHHAVPLDYTTAHPSTTPQRTPRVRHGVAEGYDFG